MEEKFTIQEIKNYLLSQDSLGDIHYNLSAEKIRKANESEDEIDLLDGEIEQDNTTVNNTVSIQIEDSRHYKFVSIMKDLNIKCVENAGLCLITMPVKTIDEIKDYISKLCREHDIFFSFTNKYSYGENIE